MIIVSQDREWIFNFDNTTSIGIDEENTLKVISIAGKWNILGNYKTKERAKEVLHEITKNYESKLLIKFNSYLSDEHERLMYKKYKNLSENTSIFVADDTKDFQYIPCQKNVYYMPEE